MPTTTANMNMQYSGSSAPLLSEILTKVNNAKMKEDKVKVLFEYDKRQTFAGVNTCFDHSRYIIQDFQTGGQREDIIPYTVLDVCNKANLDRRRCYQYA